MGQINVKTSRPNRKTVKHPNEQNISTTLGFGEVTTLGFVEMQGRTKAKGHIGSLIRTATMPVPTFGEISYRTYARYIPTTDIFRNNENLKSELPITTQFGTFIPQNQPYINSNWLSVLLLSRYTKYNVYVSNEEIVGNSNDKTLIINKAKPDTRFITPYDKLEYFSNYIEYRFNAYGNEWVNPIKNGISTNKLVEDTRVTIENCDFYAIRNKRDSQTMARGDMEQDEYNSYIYCFKLTKQGKTLKRNLENLGWKYSLRNEKRINILPFMAYYKGYFELFQPKNTATNANVYTNTNCFKLSDYICEHDISNVINFETNEEVTTWSTQTNLLLGLLEEISETYYYSKPNLVTAHIATPSIGTQTQSVTTQSIKPMLGNRGTNNQNANGQPTAPYTDGISAPSLKLLMRMYVISNKHSVIGGNIRKLIQSLYGYDPDTIDGIVYDCGRNAYDIDISMIPSQADTYNGTNGAQLGEIGGLATGKSKEGLNWECHARTDGYLIFYATIIPNSQFYQGTDPRLHHGTKGKYSLYNEDFDSIGLEINTKSIIMGERLIEIPQITIGQQQYGTDNAQENTAFGFIPRYMDYKVLAGDIVSGDLRRYQYKMQLRPYFLGKEISEGAIVAERTNNTETDEYKVTIGEPKELPIATPELRTIGKYNWLENFNKIFYSYEERLIVSDNPLANSFQEVFGFDDPFIIHNENKYDKFDNMKPTTESFETDGEDSNAIETEHA